MKPPQPTPTFLLLLPAIYAAAFVISFVIGLFIGSL